MKRNMGLADRIIRALAAVVIAILYFNASAYNILYLLLGGVLVLTSIVGFCPLYLPFKISTIKGSTGHDGKKGE